MTAPAAPPKKRDWSLRSRAVRAVIYQIVALGLIASSSAGFTFGALENQFTGFIFSIVEQPARKTARDKAKAARITCLRANRA